MKSISKKLTAILITSFAVLLAISAGLTVKSTAKAESPPDTVIIPGDVDDDGEVAISDVVTLARSLIGEFELRTFQIEAADVDDNETMDIKDLLKIVLHLSGKTQLPNGTEEPTAALNDDVIVLTQEQSENFIDGAAALKFSEDGKLTVEIPDGINLSAGDIFMVQPTDGNPLGVTGKVESVNGNTVVMSEPAIDEVFSELYINNKFNLSNAEILDVWTEEGVEFETAVSDGFQPYYAAKSGEMLPRSDFKTPEMAYTFNVTYPLTSNAKLTGKYGFRDLVLDIRYDMSTLEFDAVASMVEVANAGFEMNGEEEFSADKTLGYVLFDLGTMSPRVGAGEPIITTLAGGIELNVSIGGAVSGEFKYNVGFETYIKTGFKIKGDSFTPVKEVQRTEPSISLDAEVNLEAEALIGLDAVVYVAGTKTASIENSFGLFADAEIHANITNLGADIGGSGSIALKFVGEVKARLKLLGVEIFDKSKSLYDITVWEGSFKKDNNPDDPDDPDEPYDPKTEKDWAWDLHPIYAEDGVTVTDTEIVILKYRGTGGDVVIPSKLGGERLPVTRLSDSGVFMGCKELTSVAIPETVTFIGRNAFSGCINLEHITVPDSVISIGNTAFKNCKSLEHIAIPDGVTVISDAMFENCESLTSIEIPDSIKDIQSRAFTGCISLTKIEIPDSVTDIQSSAFYNCTMLESVRIGSGLTTVEESAFSGCTSLTSIEIPDSVTNLGDYAFRNCTSLKNVIIGNSLTSIDYYTFENVPIETLNINMPNIDTNAFHNIKTLKELTIGNSVTSIEDSVFSGCTNLRTIYGYSGSYAETWAKDYGYEFVSVG